MSTSRKCPFQISVAESVDKLVKSLSDVLRRCASQALADRPTFRVGLSGGSLVELLTRTLVAYPLDTTDWKFFFCDERYVPHDHNDSTYWAYKSQFQTQLPNILDNQFVKADTNLPLDDCAKDYEKRVIDEFGTSCPEFDLLLLGMGPDGHTCSLFPEQPEVLKETRSLIIPIRNSPKPPPERITFTLPLINSAKDVVFVVTGKSKADVVKRVFIDLDKELPSAWIEPSYGQLTLIADSEAGSSLDQATCSATFY